MRVLNRFIVFLVFLTLPSFLFDKPSLEGPSAAQDPRFPKDFYFGAASSSHQVEGGTSNQWTKWERANAERLAKEASPNSGFGGGKGTAPNWELIKLQAKNPENYISGIAVDHYHRYGEDLTIAQALGLNACRFSLEWSRIEPAEGRFDFAEIEHYRQMIRRVRSMGIEPFVGLWHWTEPLWFTERGGWESIDALNYFSSYVRKVIEELGTEAKYWIPVNEIETYAGASYLLGLWPPQKRNLFSYDKVTHNLIEAHREAYKIIKASNKNAQVGSALSYTFFQAAEGILKPLNNLVARLADWHLNHHIRKSIVGDSDFLGMNFYQRCVIQGATIFYSKGDVPRSDMGWELYPQGILFALRELRKYKKPIFITENGLADSQDKFRAWFIRTTLGYVFQAISEGIDIKGYFYWSLLDNFEWDKGFWPAFGLVHVNRQTLERSVRPSAWEFARIIRSSRNR
jgi:beta-glucosidase